MKTATRNGKRDYTFGKRSVIGLTNESGEDFSRRGRGRSVRAEEPKTDIINVVFCISHYQQQQRRQNNGTERRVDPDMFMAQQGSTGAGLSASRPETRDNISTGAGLSASRPETRDNISTGAGLSASRPETRDNISRGKLHPAIHTDCTDIHHAGRHGIISHEANSILLFTLTVQTFITPGDMG